MTCDVKCWTQVVCTLCKRYKAPRGRSTPFESYDCDHECPGYSQEPQPPHLWNEHDSTRHYSDPEGWAAHLASCEECRHE